MKKVKEMARKAGMWMYENPKKTLLIAAVAAAFVLGARLF